MDRPHRVNAPPASGRRCIVADATMPAALKAEARAPRASSTATHAGAEERQHADLRESSDGADRAVGLRQVDVPALLQPHARSDPGNRYEGEIMLHPDGVNILGPKVDPIEVRMRIGMVFQKPNPFPKSIFENVAYGLRVRGVSASARHRRAGRDGAARRRAVGRGEGPAGRIRRSTCPAASSSGCASRARSPSSPSCCCSTSRPPRSTRSRPRASRS